MQHNLVKVDTVLEGEVIGITQVMATIQIVVPTERELLFLLLNRMASLEEQYKEVVRLHRLKNKMVSIDPAFATTKDAAAFIGVDPSFLRKRQGTAFKLGKNFFKPQGQSIIRWSLASLSEWMKIENSDLLIDDELAELLERS